MNKRIKRKKTRNNVVQRLELILNKFSLLGTVENIEYSSENVFLDNCGNSVATFNINELPWLCLKVVLCKNGYVALCEHEAYEFDLNPGKATIDISVISDDSEEGIFESKVQELKSYFENLIEQKYEDSELYEEFKLYFTKIKEKRFSLAKSKNQFFTFLEEYKSLNSESVVDIDNECVVDGGNDSQSIYELNVVLNEDCSLEEKKRIYMELWNHSFSKIGDLNSIQFRISSIVNEKK